MNVEYCGQPYVFAVDKFVDFLWTSGQDVHKDGR